MAPSMHHLCWHPAQVWSMYISVLNPIKSPSLAYLCVFLKANTTNKSGNVSKHFPKLQDTHSCSCEHEQQMCSWVDGKWNSFEVPDFYSLLPMSMESMHGLTLMRQPEHFTKILNAVRDSNWTLGGRVQPRHFTKIICAVHDLMERPVGVDIGQGWEHTSQPHRKLY
jgi:hypothetical protein